MKLSTQRIRNISTSLRTFSRGDTTYKLSANIHEGIDSTLLILQHRLKANHYRPAIKVIKEYGNIPPVRCYLGQLNQVFMNLLANAIEALDEVVTGYTYAVNQAKPAQYIKIITQLSENNQNVIITIKDNGRGMTEEVKSCIFDHLFTTKSVGQGTGLGLSISQKIIEEKHKGSLTCESILGEGTEFIISIPI
nr:ATP-binding protein [Nodularia spumigena]